MPSQKAVKAYVDANAGGGSAVVDLGSLSGGVTVDLDDGASFRGVLSGNVTGWTLSGATAGQECQAVIEITQDAATARTVTWPAWKWAKGVPHVMSSALGAVDVVGLRTRDGGATVQAWVVGQAFAGSPDQISGLKLWLKADGVLWQDSARTTRALLADAPVGCWDDASGTGNHVTQGTAAKRPLLKLGAAGGRPAVRFDGSNDTLSSTTASGCDSQAFTQFAVVKKLATGSTDILGTGSTAGAGNTEWYFAAEKHRLDVENTSTLVAANTAIGLTDYRVVAIVSDPTLGSGWATLATAITDGFIDGTDTTPRTFNAGANVWVGSERDAAQWFNGDIAEILRFNRALTPTETNQVGAYLAARYRAVWVGV